MEEITKREFSLNKDEVLQAFYQYINNTTPLHKDVYMELKIKPNGSVTVYVTPQTKQRETP